MRDTGTPRSTACALRFADAAAFLQVEGKTFRQQKDYDPLYCDTLSTAAIWNQTCNIPMTSVGCKTPVKSCEVPVTGPGLEQMLGRL